MIPNLEDQQDYYRKRNNINKCVEIIKNFMLENTNYPFEITLIKDNIWGHLENSLDLAIVDTMQNMSFKDRFKLEEGIGNRLDNFINKLNKDIQKELSMFTYQVI